MDILLVALLTVVGLRIRTGLHFLLILLGSVILRLMTGHVWHMVLLLLVIFVFRLLGRMRRPAAARPNVKIQTVALSELKHNRSFRSAQNGVYIANGDKPLGAVLLTDKSDFSRKSSLIKSGRVVRSSERRRRASVPGFPTGRGGAWHRTHLIPFRHSLSEGDDVAGLLFAGRSELNSGGNYDGGSDNVQLLIDAFFDKKRIDYRVLSLDDVERFFDFLVRTQKVKGGASAKMLYRVLLGYDPGHKVPSRITVEIVNLSRGETVFKHTFVQDPNVDA